MTDIGVATRVHMREERARIYYRLGRNIWRADQRSLSEHEARSFLFAFAMRSRWSALREIIEAEEQRAKAAAA